MGFRRGAGIVSEVEQFAEAKWANVAIRDPFQKNLANVMHYGAGQRGKFNPEEFGA